MLTAALLLLGTLPFDPVVPDEVEAVEVNHYNCVPGLNSGTQLLFWEVHRGIWFLVDARPLPLDFGLNELPGGGYELMWDDAWSDWCSGGQAVIRRRVRFRQLWSSRSAGDPNAEDPAPSRRLLTPNPFFLVPREPYE